MVWFKGTFKTYAYENTKKHGFEFLKNDTLRRLLPTIFEYDINWVNTLESRQEDYNNSIVTPFLTEHFDSSDEWDLEGLSFSGKIIPNDYNQLRQNKKYKNILKSSFTKREMDVFFQTQLKFQMDRALAILNKELDNY